MTRLEEKYLKNYTKYIEDIKAKLALAEKLTSEAEAIAYEHGLIFSYWNEFGATGYLPDSAIEKYGTLSPKFISEHCSVDIPMSDDCKYIKECADYTGWLTSSMYC